VPAPDGDGHSPHSDGDRIAAEGSEVQRLDRHALIETEMPQAGGFALPQLIPADRCDVRLGPDLQAVERKGVMLKGRVHCCD